MSICQKASERICVSKCWHSCCANSVNLYKKQNKTSGTFAPLIHDRLRWLRNREERLSPQEYELGFSAYATTHTIADGHITTHKQTHTHTHTHKHINTQMHMHNKNMRPFVTGIVRLACCASGRRPINRTRSCNATS